MAELSKGYPEYISDCLPPPWNTPEGFGKYILAKMQRHKTLCTVAMAEVTTFLKASGIEGFLEDMNEVHLDLFDEKTARQFMFLIFSGREIVTPVTEIDRILELTGNPIPYFLQLFLDALCRECRERKVLSHDDIEHLYERDLLGPGSKRYFESVVKQLERYKRYGTRSRAGAEALLSHLAMNPMTPLDILKEIWQRTTGGEAHFETVMALMHDDFYIREEDRHSLSFGSKMLRDWWKKHGLAGGR